MVNAFFLSFLSFIFLVQAEAEELAIKVDALTAENTTLKTEISRLKENSEKLKLENTTVTVQHCLLLNSDINRMYNYFTLLINLFEHRRT